MFSAEIDFLKLLSQLVFLREMNVEPEVGPEVEPENGSFLLNPQNRLRLMTSPKICSKLA